MSDHSIHEAKRIVRRYLRIHGFSATATQFRFLVREAAQRIEDRFAAKYAKRKLELKPE